MITIMEENKQFDKKSLRYVMGKTSDFGELAKDCVAFANTNGGYLAIGIEDGAELPDEQQRITEDLPEKVIKRINELTINVALQPEIITAENGGQYLKLHIYPSQSAIASTTKGVGKGTKYEISPLFLAQTKVQSPTTLKTIEPHRLKALILEDLRFYPNSSVAEMATRLPDVVYAELEKVVRNMAKKEEIKPIGGRKYRRYSLK